MRLPKRVAFLAIFAIAILFVFTARGQTPYVCNPFMEGLRSLVDANREGRVRRSTTRLFCLDYELEGVEAKDLDEVQLWGSKDLGITWELWGKDIDKTSPLDVETNGRGICGFVILVKLKGLDAPLVITGQRPDIWVFVRGVPPEAIALKSFANQAKTLDK